ncbi:MAG: CHASE3 domain-containing protein [Deltaproteobacteria bacterium]|nr:CHASE3 domain-containing protein [Deltaproteobacteria bacterium]
MALLAAVVLWRVNAQIASVAWVEHTYQVIECSKDAQIDLRDMAVSANSYWFSADKRYLTDFQNADRRLRTDLKRISALVIDNPPQQERVLKATELHGAWADAWSETIQALKAHDNQALPNRLAQLDAQRQAVLDVLSEITDEEDRLLRERKGWQETENRVIFIFVPLLFVIGALVLSYEGWREMSRASGQFAQALARAGEASRAKDNFLAIVSHELRNPLNSIMLLTHILLSSQEDQQKVLERVKAIDRAARTQAQLIEDLLDVSRVESGRLKLDVQATNLGQVVKAAVDSMRIAAEAKSINLYDIIDTSVPVIAGDPKRLEQVVWNLVSNAIKFTPKGGKVQVRLERINSHVDIVVTDNGQGIAPSSLPQVFDRF